MKNSLYVPKNTSRSSLISIIQNEITTASSSSLVTITGNQTITGVKTFSTAPIISTITNTGTLTLPTSTGTLALVSQVPTNADYVDMKTNQTVGGNKIFSNDTSWNGISSIGPTGTFSIASPSATATVAFGGLSNITLTLPATAGVIASLAANQTFTGNNFFQGQLVSTASSSATLASSPIYINPATTPMSAANDYRWFYMLAPPTSGSSSGTASTFTIAGPPSTAATNNYSAQIIAGVTSIPSGTVGAPSLVFGNSNTTGLYSSAANTVNVSISGAVAATVNSTGTTLATALYANANTFCRDASGNYMLTRALKGVSVPAAAIVTFQMTLLSGSTFGSDGAGVFIVTMALESGDFGSTRASWSAIVERSGYSGGKAAIVATLSSTNVSLASVTVGGLISVTVTAATTSNYAFTQMQVCY